MYIPAVVAFRSFVLFFRCNLKCLPPAHRDARRAERGEGRLDLRDATLRIRLETRWIELHLVDS